MLGVERVGGTQAAPHLAPIRRRVALAQNIHDAIHLASAIAVGASHGPLVMGDQKSLHQ